MLLEVFNLSGNRYNGSNVKLLLVDKLMSTTMYKHAYKNMQMHCMDYLGFGLDDKP